jgi:parallel beta-helix repeat protein
MWGKGAFIATMLAIAAIIPASAAGVQNARQQGPITISECRSIDQPGPYRLVNNLKAAGNCLVVTVEGVTIDLGGFAISGDGTGTGILVKQASGTIPQARIIVRNGDISNFAQALNLSGEVEGLRVAGNARGILVGVGVVRANIVQFNRSAGIRLTDGIVASNLLVGNDTGIFVEEAAIVSGNQASGNKIGIDVIGTGSALSGNIANGNSQIGLRVACPSNLADNTAIGNGHNLVLIGKACGNQGNLFGP